jgi:hypothetical protein
MTAITDTLKLSIRKEQEKNKTLHLLNELCLSLEARIMANIKDYDVAELEDFVESAKHLNKVAGKKYDVSFVETYIETL